MPVPPPSTPRRRTAPLAAILASVAALCALSAAAGTPLEPSELRQSLFGTCLATDRDGWMVGELGRVFRTSDGGATWMRQETDTKRPFLAVSCVGPRDAWIAGKEGILYHTTDGGETWQAVRSGSDRHLFTLAFANAQRGHGAGDFGTMIHTEDGGRTWTSERVPPEIALPEEALDMGVEPGDVNLYAASYGDADHVWVVGEFGTIMASADGGRTWTQQHAPFESTLFGVYFADPQRGWAVGIDAVIVHTTDGGLTWTPQRPPVRGRSFYDVVVQGDRGWIVGESGTMLTSEDGGGTWTLVPVPIELAANWIRSVALRPSGRGLAVGADGLVFRLDGARFERLGARPSGASS